MKTNRSYLKSLVVSLSLIISLLVISEAQALYYFEWYDAGQEWYTLDGDIYPTTVEANEWNGFFTLPDSAVTYGFIDGDYQDISLDLTQYLDFSLSGNLISGNYMEAIAFDGSLISTPQSINSNDISIWFFTGDNISYLMADPSWNHTPTNVTIIGEDHWFSYVDEVFDPDTNSMVDAYISHDGVFVGHYVDDVNGDDDISPPELIDFSFTPTTINVGTGTQSVTFIAHVNDDLTGISFVEVTFNSPSTQQFEKAIASKPISGSINDGIYKRTITFPQYSEVGVWEVDITLGDTIGNIIQIPADKVYLMGFSTDLKVISAIDTDKDGIEDSLDNCPNDANNDGDSDGICGDVDNCPNKANADQTDSDSDGTGDACEVKAMPWLMLLLKHD